jgi:outer membrane protein assembly factor BamB
MINRPSPTRPFVIMAAIILLAATARAEDLKVPLGGIGFRYDNTGVCPPDWNPPADFDGLIGVNLRWKAALPNHSSSSPVAVGDKVFVVCMPGWPVGQDMAQLLCFDAVSGKELWRRNLDDLAGMPEPQYAEAKAVRQAFWQRIVKLNRLRYEHKGSTDETRRAEIEAEMASLGVRDNLMGQMDNDFRWTAGFAELSALHSKDLGPQAKNLLGYGHSVWGLTCIDLNFPTPVSDGKRIFVVTGRRSVHAFDLDGNVLWQVRQTDAKYPYHWTEDLANAVLVAEKKLIFYLYDCLWAYDTDTGSLVWKVESPHRGCPACS